jgi:hypothetical protein
VYLALVAVDGRAGGYAIRSEFGAVLHLHPRRRARPARGLQRPLEPDAPSHEHPLRAPSRVALHGQPHGGRTHSALPQGRASRWVDRADQRAGAVCRPRRTPGARATRAVAAIPAPDRVQ